MTYIKELLISLWIILIPFQDTSLQGTYLSFLGASLSFLPISILIFISFIETLLKGRFNIVAFIAIIYVFLVSFAGLLVYGIASHNENLLLKTFKLFILNALFIFPMLYIILNKKTDFIRLKNVVRITFFLIILSVLVNDVLQIHFFTQSEFLHYHENLNMRPRGFALESSTLGSLIVVMGLIYVHFVKGIREKVFVLTLTVVFLVFTASKGGLLALLLSLFIYYLLRLPKDTLRNPLYIVFGFLFIIFAAYFSVPKILEMINNDLYNSTSIATRSTLALSTLIIMIHNPLGVGYGGFLPVLSSTIPDAMNLLNHIFALNFNEVSNYVNANSDTAISTKTFLFDNIIYFGIPFLLIVVIVHYIFLKNMIRESSAKYLTIALIFAIIALSTYNGGLGQYQYSLLYGVIINHVRNQKNISSVS